MRTESDNNKHHFPLCYDCERVLSPFEHKIQDIDGVLARKNKYFDGSMRCELTVLDINLRVGLMNLSMIDKMLDGEWFW